MQPRTIVAAAATLAVLTLLSGCGAVYLGGAPAKTPTAPPAPTVTAVGYALADARAPAGAAAIHINLLISGGGASATWTTLAEAVTAVERALRAAGAPASGVGVAGAPSLTAQIGPGAVEAAQTVVAVVPSAARALRVLKRLDTSTLAGYDGYYLAPVGVPTPTPAAERAADARALAQAQARASQLAAAQGRRLGALISSQSDLLAPAPCAPVSGCTSATGDIVPSPGAGQLVVAVRATFATRKA